MNASHNAGHDPLPLSALEANLTAAQDELDAANEECRRATKRQCDARNRLRDAQKALDTRMVELRKNHATEEWLPLPRGRECVG